MSRKPSALIIYTGGTIGMVKDSLTGSLMPVNFERLKANIPEIEKLDIELDIHTFTTTIDSSNMQISDWIRLVEIIEENYTKYDGFVILHGSDTMAYTASALSFMLENLSKPVILTGSQLPIGVLRTDAKENFITALEIAVWKEAGLSKISDVCIYFEYHLLKGNRTSKISSSHFNAFESTNFPAIAEAGVQISFNETIIKNPSSKPTLFHKKLDPNIAILKIFPGMTAQYVHAILSIPNLKAVVLETFGSGNAPTQDWFLKALRDAIAGEICVVNITQCSSGSVLQGKYKTSIELESMGVVSGYDMTTEAAVTKLMFLLANCNSIVEVKQQFCKPICEELTLLNWN